VIDEEDDAWRRPPLGEVLGPLPPWSLAMLAGAFLGGHAPRPMVTGSIALLLAAVLAGACRGTSARWTGGGLVVVCLLVGVTLTTARAITTDLGLLPALADRGGVAEMMGRVAHEPRRIETGWHVVVKVESVGDVPTRERAAVTLRQDPPPVLGQRFVAAATARPLPDGGYGRWLAQQHATVVLDMLAWQEVGRPGRWQRASEHVRDAVRRASARHAPPSVGGLLAGLATGDTRTLPEDDRLAMEATALTHLTAVSGTHVALVAAGTLGLCVALRIPAGPRRAVLGAVLAWFAFVTRFEPSVLRASAMAAMVLLAGARGHVRDARHALAGAVLLLVLIDPRLAGSLGLLLSASAAAGVLVLAPLVRRRLPWLPARVADLLSVTIGAQIAVVPLLLTAFGTVPMAAIPANMMAVPAAALAASVGFVAAVVSAVSVQAGGWLFAVAGWPARIVLLAAHTFAGRGGGADLARPLTVAALLAGCWLLLSTPRSRSARFAAVAVGILVAGALAPVVVGGRAPVRLTVTAIDVGQGDAYLLESPAARILVDAGGDDRAARWLRANGRRHLDLVVVSHPHADHVAGMVDVLQTVRVGAIWLRTHDPDAPVVAEVLAAAAERHVPVRAPSTGDRSVVGDLELAVLGPDPGRPYRHADSEINESSLVVRATWAGRRVLFPGDAELAAQADLLARAADDPARAGLVAEVLLVPHHGAATTDAAFIAAVAPQVALISVGADNTYGHPAPSTVRTLQELGARVHRTDLEGTVRVEVPAPARPVTDGGGHPPPVGSGHDSRAPDRRRRRPAAAPRTRAGTGRPARAGPRVDGRHLRRAGDRSPARVAHRVAVRRPHLRGRARRRGRVR
jgi:competence protein ComEC